MCFCNLLQSSYGNKLYCVGTYEIERDHIYYDYTRKCLQSIHIRMSD